MSFHTMVTRATSSAFCGVASPSSSTSLTKASMTDGGCSDNLDARGFKPKPASLERLQVKVDAHTPPKISGTKVGLTKPKESTKDEGATASSPPPRTFINQLPDWGMLLAAITTIFLSAEKQWTNLDWKPRRPDMLVDPFGLGSIVNDGLIFRQNFVIRSYEIGADQTASMETLMNHLQETALNHVRSAGLLGDGFGSTPEMSRKNLIWVITRMQILVDFYPFWGDIVEVETWIGASGKNGIRRDWLVRDSKTGQTVTRATSVWVMMNKQTRKLSKIPEEVRGEIEPYLMDHVDILDVDNRKLAKLDDNTADYVQKGLTPRWSDMDVNQHVNNVKYIGWILESPPISILETHKLAGMTLEYSRECGRDSVLKSLTTVSGDCTAGSPKSRIECEHLLQLEGGAEIMRGRTEWRPKPADSFRGVGQIPAWSM